MMPSLTSARPIVNWSHDRLWLPFAALILSIGWLLPNHYYPWTSFHSEAWIGVFLIIIGTVYLSSQKHVRGHWSGLSVLVLFTLAIPPLQYAFDILAFSGDVWIGLLYLSGFLLASLIGNIWQRSAPNRLGDLIFLAIGAAALVSVGLQLYQWFGFTNHAALDQIWVYELSGDRPYANLAQPNQLATLLVWGLLAGVWARTRGQLSLTILYIYMAVIILGLVLTQSRTAWLAMTLFVLAVFHWRKCWTSQEIIWFVAAAAALFVALSFSIEGIAALLLLDLQPNIADRIGGNSVRIAIWRMFLDASTENPWFGYGWNQVRPAQLDIALAHPDTHGISYAQSHNLFVDFIVWVGLPLGLLLSAAVLFWFWARSRTIRAPEHVVLWIAVGAVGLHAMVEYPLHYAYFLLPTGLFIGMLDAASQVRPVFVTNRSTLTTFLLLLSIGLGLTVNDYFRVESNFAAMRFEQSGIANSLVQDAPKTILLTQLRENIRMARFDEFGAVSNQSLDWMRTVTTSYPSLSNLHKLSFVLAKNGYGEEARLWLRRTCAVVPKGQCEMAQRAWEEKREKYAEIRRIEWPGANANHNP